MAKLVMIVAHVATFMIFSAASVFVCLSRLVWQGLDRSKRSRPLGQMQLLLTGTFYNENWFRSHILPLANTKALDRIYVVTDRPLCDIDKVVYRCPPAWVIRLFGHTIPRAVMVFWVSLRYRPDVLMGYHIMPNAVLCLLAAAMLNKRSVYQMTGGPIQITGGGFKSENALLCRLGRHSPLLERLLYHLVRQFDLVVVRGTFAIDFLGTNQLARKTLIVQGSVDMTRFQPCNGEKKYDLVLVARHIKEKQPHLFVDIVDELRKTRPEIRAAMVGEGPLTPGLKEKVARNGLERNVCFLGHCSQVSSMLSESALFVLTSQTEGLSIAVVEAMAAGLPVLAPDVGEMGQLVVDQETGILIRPERVAETARIVDELLADPARRRRMGDAARTRAGACNSIEAVAGRWDGYFSEVTDAACEVRVPVGTR